GARRPDDAPRDPHEHGDGRDEPARPARGPLRARWVRAEPDRSHAARRRRWKAVSDAPALPDPVQPELLHEELNRITEIGAASDASVEDVPTGSGSDPAAEPVSKKAPSTRRRSTDPRPARARKTAPPANASAEEPAQHEAEPVESKPETPLAARLRAAKLR